MNEFKKEIIKDLKKTQDKIINKLSLQEEKDKEITVEDVTLFLQIAREITLMIDVLGAKNV